MCEKCASPCQDPTKGLSKEQLKQLVEAQKRMMKINEEFTKESQPYIDQYRKLLKTMKTCKLCKETEFKFVPCAKHYKEIEKISQAIVKIRTSFKLKDEVNNVVEETQ